MNVSLEYLDSVVVRSKERRRTCFGKFKTSGAEAAEIVLAVFAPVLIAEIRQLRDRLKETTGK